MLAWRLDLKGLVSIDLSLPVEVFGYNVWIFARNASAVYENSFLLVGSKDISGIIVALPDHFLVEFAGLIRAIDSVRAAIMNPAVSVESVACHCQPPLRDAEAVKIRPANQ